MLRIAVLSLDGYGESRGLTAIVLLSFPSAASVSLCPLAGCSLILSWVDEDGRILLIASVCILEVRNREVSMWSPNEGIRLAGY